MLAGRGAPGAGSVVVPAAGGNGSPLWWLRTSSAGSRGPALSGVPGADCKSLILRNRACLVSLLKSV